jgi:hypothetical protein
MRISGIEIINAPHLLGAVLNLAKVVLKPKLFSRVSGCCKSCLELLFLSDICTQRSAFSVREGSKAKSSERLWRRVAERKGIAEYD